ncbi:MAG: LPS export ABC transporter periplasmic protein LptC [Pseudomonadota bacterium]|nr:LPS export ABC transporter periplasmic protein LptC [Pseudomonadota bacterium]
MTNTSENTQIKTKNDEIDRANSHTRNLKLINNLILLLIILGAGTLVYFINFEGQKITEIENVTPIPVEKDTSMAENTVEIKNSIISGIDGQNQYYEISTERTWNSIDNKDIVEMSGIKAKLLLKNDLEINIIGNSARFNHKTQHLQLESDIVISSNKNVGVLIESIKIDLQKKIISSPRPVKIAYEDICIVGKNFEINNNGDKIKFTDGVNLIIGENTLCITS